MSGQKNNRAIPALMSTVVDMYEHAFHIDYCAAAAKYIDAFFANIQWGLRRETRGVTAQDRHLGSQ